MGRLIIEEPWSLDQVEIDTRIDDGVLDLNKMDFSFLSGRFSNAGVIGYVDSGFKLKADSKLRGLTVQSAMTTLGFEPIVETTLHGDEMGCYIAIDGWACGGDERRVELLGEEGRIDIPEIKFCAACGATQAASIIVTAARTKLLRQLFKDNGLRRCCEIEELS